MKIIISGINNNDLITLASINAAKMSDIIIVPCSSTNKSHAENIITKYIQDKKILRINFPMTYDKDNHKNIIISQLMNQKNEWIDSKIIFFPVIGDSMIYSTANYLIEAIKEIINDIEIEYIPGISAHSLASSTAKKFMASGEEIFTVIPGTADINKIINALKTCDNAAIYKPKAIKNIHSLNIPSLFKKIIRVDYAGLPELEKIIYGNSALENITEYLSIILLWKN